MTKDKLGAFLTGLAGSAGLLKRAMDNGSFIECVCILSNQIDALLRIGIILDWQLEEDTKNVIDELLYQGDEPKIISEKQIFQRALDSGIIDERLYTQLHTLYGHRNRVVHRYIISDITTKDVLLVAVQYDEIRDKIGKIVAHLEKEQIRSGKGMTVPRPEQIRLTTWEIVKKMEQEKHGGLKFE